MSAVAENIQTEMPEPIVFTDSAAAKVADLIAEEGNPELKLRVFVQGGGCSGFQYGFTFDEIVKASGLEALLSDSFTAAAPPEDLKAEPKLVTEIFQSPNDLTLPHTLQTSKGYGIFELAKVEAPALLPLDQVKTKISEKLAADALADAARRVSAASLALKAMSSIFQCSVAALPSSRNCALEAAILISCASATHASAGSATSLLTAPL